MSARIVIVEDDPDLLETVADALEDAGYTVTAQPSSHAALEWAAAGHDFDLVLTDVRMAGVDGIQALSQLREHRPNVRGIIMTGYASPDAPQRAISAGAWDYLFKPFSEEQLLTAVDRVLTAEQKSEHAYSTHADRTFQAKAITVSTGSRSLNGSQSTPPRVSLSLPAQPPSFTFLISMVN